MGRKSCIISLRNDWLCSFLPMEGEGDVRAPRNWVYRFLEVWLLLRLCFSCKLLGQWQTDRISGPAWLWSLSVGHLFFFLCSWAVMSAWSMSHISHLWGYGLWSLCMPLALSLPFVISSKRGGFSCVEVEWLFANWTLLKSDVGIRMW